MPLMQRIYQTISHWLAQNGKLLLIVIAIVALLFGTDHVMEMATDTYPNLRQSPWHFMLHVNGRPATAFGHWFFGEYMDLSPEHLYATYYWMGFVSLALAILILALILKEKWSDDLGVALVATAVIANLFSIEHFLFIEKGMFSAGILVTVIAFYFMLRFMQTGHWQNLLWAVLCLAISIYTYQVYVGLFVVLCLPAIIYYAPTWKKFWHHNILVAALYGSAMVLSLCTLTFILHSDRVGSIPREKWLSNTAFAVQRTFVESGEMMPRWSFLLVSLVLVALNFYLAYCRRSAKHFWGTIYIIIGTLVTGYIPVLLGTTYYAPRAVYPVAALLGVLAAYFIVNLPAQKKYHKGEIVIKTVLLLFIACQIYCFTNVFIDRYKVNQTEKYIGLMILGEIARYESTSGAQIQQIAVYEDEQISNADHGLNQSWLNPKALSTWWSDVELLNYYGGREWSRVAGDQEHADYCAAHDWDIYNPAQLNFVDDTLHWCAY